MCYSLFDIHIWDFLLVGIFPSSHFFMQFILSTVPTYQYKMDPEYYLLIYADLVISNNNQLYQ